MVFKDEIVSYVANLPNVYLFIFYCVALLVLTIAGILFVKRYVPMEIRYKDNAVIGNISALISIIYGVLVGITALYLINNVSYTADSVQREANAAANLYRESKWLPDPAKSHIQTDIQAYLKLAIATEWPLMETGKKVDGQGDILIDKIAATLHNHLNDAGSQVFVAQQMLNNLTALYDARQQRIQMSYISLAAEMWYVILIGSILTVAINFLFGMNFYLHLLTVTAGALMAASMLFLLTALDKPFQGEFVIEPDAMRMLLKQVDSDIAHAPALKVG